MTDARLQRRRTISRLYWFLRDAFSCVRGGEKIWSMWQIQLSTSTTQKIWIVRIRLGHWRKKHIFDKTSAKSYSADGIQFQQHNAILRFCCSLGPTCVFIFRQFCKCKLRRTWTSSYDQRVKASVRGGNTIRTWRRKDLIHVADPIEHFNYPEDLDCKNQTWPLT